MGGGCEDGWGGVVGIVGGESMGVCMLEIDKVWLWVKFGVVEDEREVGVGGMVGDMGDGDRVRCGKWLGWEGCLG